MPRQLPHGDAVDVAEVTAKSRIRGERARALQQFRRGEWSRRGIPRPGYAAGRGLRVHVLQRQGGGAGKVALRGRGVRPAFRHPNEPTYRSEFRVSDPRSKRN